ncbi:MAG TPA: HAMP domain-containing sensor histidine kinase [Patescibacteria group bacterium]|jgi:signal transduction histidine kinase|nr:HAMP domain-containing sensor histidine kinase [Patescibacteria group bacterium]
MFHSARLKLTAWYLLIIMIISISFSTFIYFGAAREYDRILRLEQYRVMHPMRPGIILQRPPSETELFSISPQQDNELVEWAKLRVLEALFGINVIILFLSALAGYFLAGRTLRPIKNMLDEQNRFITDASHELNTPLTALKTSLEVNLRDKKLSLHKAKKVLSSNLEDVNNLQSLSEELMELIMYQKQNGNYKIAKIALSDIIKTAVGQTKSLAEKKKIVIKVDAPKTFVMGDEKSLKKLFVILLDNAIKYTNSKSPISVVVKKNDFIINILVKDGGIGIKKEDMPHIFDRFYRADRSRTKQRIEGYGLGLSIAKRIVALHNGSIRVESEVRKGSVFTVTLPKIK